jgi:hypothetical protein
LKLYLRLAIILAVLACLGTFGTASVFAQSGEIPSLPLIFSGDVSVEGRADVSGLELFAKVDDYTSRRVTVKSGKYVALQVTPPSDHAGREIRFYLAHVGGTDAVEAMETAEYRVPTFSDFTRKQNLFFSKLPLPPPTPTPSPTPTMTPTPTPVLPIPGEPAVRTVSMWVLVVGVLGVIGGIATIRLASSRRR